jgi:hypothetical protein
MMWIAIWRPAVVFIGALGAATGVVGSVLSKNPVASNTLMGFVIAMMVFQAVVGLVLIVVGVWEPIRRWLGFDATNGSASSS